MDIDELPAAAAAVLELARTADDPTPGDRARIDAAFSTKLQALGLASQTQGNATPHGMDTLRPSPSATVSGGVRAASYKLGLGLSGAGALAAGLWFGLQLGAPSTPARAPRSASTHTTPNAVPQAAPAAPDPVALRVLAGSGEGSTASEGAPSPAVTHPAARAPQARVSGAAGRASVTSDDALKAEVAMIEGADQALRLGQPDKALRLLSQHAAQFAHGSLREEREGLRVLTLCRLGRMQQGVEAKRRFLQAAPRSVLAERVRQACEPNASRKAGVP